MSPRSAARIAAAAAQLPQSSQRPPRWFVMATVLVVAILATQLTVALMGAAVGVRESENVAMDTFTYVGDVTAERVARHAEGVADVVKGTVVSIEHDDGVASFDDLARDMYQRLLREPEVRAVYIGFPDGSYLEVHREANGFEQRRIEVTPERVVTEISYDTFFRPLETEVVELDYDARERPWYRAGDGSAALLWTDPFLLANTGVPAVAAVQSAMVDDEVLAVVGADLSLDTLAHVLDELPVGEGAQAFIVTPVGEVIAAPSQYSQQIAQVAMEAGRVPTADDIGVTTIGSPEMSARDDADYTSAFLRRDERYILERTFPADEGLDWVLHLEADEQQLSPGLQRIQVTMAWVTGLSIVLVLVAALLLYRVWQPLAEMRRRATTDALTGLSNRHDFERRAPRLLASARNDGDAVVLVAMDLDNFKALNDNHGHHIGDRALHVAGQALNERVRNRDLASRFGGDEFVLLLRVKSVVEVDGAVERIRMELSDHLAARVTGGEEVGVTAGYSVSYGDDATIATLLRHADTALVDGKRRKKGATYGYSPELKKSRRST